MNKHTKRISLILTSILLSTTACSESTNQSESSTITTAPVSEPVTQTASPYDELEKKDFNGRLFRISVNSKYLDEMDTAEENGDICNDAVYRRNRKIEDDYHITIKPIVTNYVNNDSQVTEITKTLLAGEDAYDLVAVYTYLAGKPALEGLYHNWKSVPYVDFDSAWWVNGANNAFTICDEQYVAVGDLSITTLLLSYAVFFNQRIVNDYLIPDLYQTVLDGDWTIDYMTSLTKDIYSDINHNDVADSGDLFGFAADNVTNLDAYPSAFNIDLTTKDANDYPVIALDLNRFTTAVEKVYDLYYGNNNSYISTGNGSEVTVFASGNAAFLTTWINNAFGPLRDMKDDYGILPYPKLDETQTNYYSNSMDNYSLLSIPKTVTDLDFVGLITEALTRESHENVVPAYYDVALTDKYARDDNSVQMLDIIMNGRKYDFSILHSGSIANYPYLFRNLISSKNTNIASEFAKIETKITSGYQDLANIYQALNEQP